MVDGQIGSRRVRENSRVGLETPLPVSPIARSLHLGSWLRSLPYSTPLQIDRLPELSVSFCTVQIFFHRERERERETLCIKGTRDPHSDWSELSVLRFVTFRRKYSPANSIEVCSVLLSKFHEDFFPLESFVLWDLTRIDFRVPLWVGLGGHTHQSGLWKE